MPYCFKTLSRLKYKKVTVGDGYSMATLHLPLQQLASSGRLCFVFLWFVHSLPLRSLGGIGVAVLEGRGNLRSV
jgi:hypothetical protein